MLVFRETTKSYRRSRTPAISQVSFQVPSGQIVGLVGLNGAGKTTLIRVATGLNLPSRGTVEVDGIDIVRQKARASRQIGWVPEIPIYPPRRSLLDLMDYLAGYHGRAGGDRNAHLALLRWVGLEAQAGDPVSSLSQGMRKRFAIAVSMIASPSNFVLDEVLNGLDPEWIRFSREWMSAMRDQGRAVLLSSHLLGEMQGLADQFAFLHHGQLLGVWPKSAIRESLPPRYVVRLTNLDATAIEFLGGFGNVTANAPYATIDNPRVPPETVTAEVMRRQYGLQEFRVEEPGLEEFFFRLIGNRSGG